MDPMQTLTKSCSMDLMRNANVLLNGSNAKPQRFAQWIKRETLTSCSMDPVQNPNVLLNGSNAQLQRLVQMDRMRNVNVLLSGSSL